MRVRFIFVCPCVSMLKLAQRDNAISMRALSVGKRLCAVGEKLAVCELSRYERQE